MKRVMKDRFARAWVRFNKGWHEDENGCDVWQKSLDPDGYGQFTIIGVVRRAHRAIWWFHHEHLDPGLVLNHTCQNRACVNIDHLEMITPEMNVYLNSDHWINKPTCRKGHVWDGAFVRPSTGYTIRTCSICRNEIKRARRKRRKELGLPYT